MKAIAVLLIIISICIGLAFATDNTIQQSQETVSASNKNLKTITYPQYGFSVEIPRRFQYREFPNIPNLVEGFYDYTEKNSTTFILVFQSDAMLAHEDVSKNIQSNSENVTKLLNHDLYINSNAVEMYKARGTVADEESSINQHTVNFFHNGRLISVTWTTEKEFSVEQEEFDAVADSIKTF
ncbi:MAG: hypothetical protein V4686_01870 [Patescibacteria group bacterium]